MEQKLHGGCLCGKVRYEVNNEFRFFHLCHCQQCQKVTGSAHASNLFIQPEKFRWTSGEDLIQRYDDPGRDFTKVFCRQCGCGLPFLIKSGRYIIVPAGSLEGEPNITPNDNIFWPERPCWYDAGLLAPRMDGFPK